jgi:hypothetical protein
MTPSGEAIFEDLEERLPWMELIGKSLRRFVAGMGSWGYVVTWSGLQVGLGIEDIGESLGHFEHQNT